LNYTREKNVFQSAIMALSQQKNYRKNYQGHALDANLSILRH